MARDWGYIARDVFSGRLCSGCINRNYNAEESTDCKYMEVPLDSSDFEVPVFAMATFLEAIMEQNYPDMLAVLLNYDKMIPFYKSFDRYMKDIILNRYKNTRLIKIEIQNKDEKVLYYGTAGAIFNELFNPIMLCTWQIHREENKYIFLRPIIRIEPSTFQYQYDIMEKFIAKKFPSICIGEGPYLFDSYYYRGIYCNCSNIVIESALNPRVKVEIDTIPFKIKETDKPSISTTNEKLLQIAIQHIDELI